jgi:hypothetical protein
MLGNSEKMCSKIVFFTDPVPEIYGQMMYYSFTTFQKDGPENDHGINTTMIEDRGGGCNL